MPPQPVAKPPGPNQPLKSMRRVSAVVSGLPKPD